MPMLLIEGVFRIAGTRPDGDTVRFHPNNPDHWDLVPGRPVRRNSTGGANLRLEGIDTLETHYRPPSGGQELHQPKEFADRAADELLSWLGFTQVQRKPDGTVTSSTPQQAPGYILTRGADPHGRCVALVGKGQHAKRSGESIDAKVKELKKTVNHHLLAVGLAYPLFYRTLFPDLRQELTAVAQKARKDGEGLWPDDKTTDGAQAAAAPTITPDVVLPKFFRRLAEYIVLNNGDPDLGGFRAFLAQKADKFTVLSDGHFTTGLDLVVEVINATEVRMTREPEDLVFDEG